MSKIWDVFICHASEDKEAVVEPLAEELRLHGLRVWYDRLELQIGDSLRRKIDEGLSNSRYGVVVVSPHFFTKEWPQRELDGLVQRELAGRKVILPVWHNVDRDDVARYSPTLADKLAGSTADGMKLLAQAIINSMTDVLLEAATVSLPGPKSESRATIKIPDNEKFRWIQSIIPPGEHILAWISSRAVNGYFAAAFAPANHTYIATENHAIRIAEREVFHTPITLPRKYEMWTWDQIVGVRLEEGWFSATVFIEWAGDAESTEISESSKRHARAFVSVVEQRIED